MTANENLQRKKKPLSSLANQLNMDPLSKELFLKIIMFWGRLDINNLILTSPKMKTAYSNTVASTYPLPVAMEDAADGEVVWF